MGINLATDPLGILGNAPSDPAFEIQPGPERDPMNLLPDPDPLGIMGGPDPLELYQPSVGPVEAGIEMSQAMMWEGLDSVAEAIGVDTPTFIKQAIEENKSQASLADLDSFGDKLLFASGQIVPAAGAALLGAVAAPFLGLSSTLGVTVGGTLASMGMTLGDLQGKAKELDPEWEANIKQLGLGVGISLLDLFAISKAKNLISPVRDLVEDVTLDSLKAARGAKNIATQIGADSVKIGAAEGLQDLSTGLGANYLTGTDIDMSRVRSLANSAAEEALIGGVLGVPLSGMNLATQRVAESEAQRQAVVADQIRDENALNAEYITSEGGEGSSIYEMTDVAGEVNDKAIAFVPMPNSQRNNGLFSRVLNTLTGNVTDKVKRSHGDNPHVQLTMQQINQTPEERRAGRKGTINEVSTPEKGYWKDSVKDFLTAGKADKTAAVERRVNGEADMSNPVDKALYKALNGDDFQNFIVGKTFGKIDVTEEGSKWVDETYIPLADTMDWNKVAADSSWQISLEEDMREAGMSEDQTKAMTRLVKEELNYFSKFGRDIGLEKQNDQFQLNMQNRMTELANASDTNPAKVRRAVSAMKDAGEFSVAKNTELTLDRKLKFAPEKWLNKYKRDGIDYGVVIGEHIDRLVEHAEHINRFGQNDELFWDQTAQAIAWGIENNKPLSGKDIEAMTDALRVSKRMHLKPISNEWRERQANIKALLNTNLLGLSVLVSIPEGLSVPMQTDMKTALQGLGSTMGIGAKDLANLVNMNHSLDGGMQIMANRANQDTRTMRKWEQVFIHYMTGLPQLQAFLTSWAAKSMDLDNRRLIQKTQSAKQAEANQAVVQLAQRGINYEKAVEWMQSGFDQDNSFYTDEYLPSIVSSARDVIVDPDPVDKPAWHSYEPLQLIAQLKGFMTVFTRRVMRGQLEKMSGMSRTAQNRELAIRLAPYVAMYLVAQMGIGGLREIISSGEIDDEKSLGRRAWNAFSYLGAAAYLVDPANAMLWRSTPVASVAGPGPSILLNLTGSAVRSMEAMDPDEFIKKVVKTVVPNMAGTGAVEDLIIEAFGAN